MVCFYTSIIGLTFFLLSSQQALRENLKLKESEEKQRRAQAAKEKAEREKLERQQKKRRLLEVNTGIFQSVLPLIYHLNGTRNGWCEIKNHLLMQSVGHELPTRKLESTDLNTWHIFLCVYTVVYYC